MLSQPTTTRFWLLAIFVLSGFAGLIYQSIWSHYLGLFLGHAAYAQSLVLAMFMGGMAAGASLVAKAGERWRNLIRWYALAEAVIGLLGLGFHWIFTSVLDISYSTILPALGGSGAAMGVRWLIAATLILPQTIMLGMTFPLMSGGIIRRFPGQDGKTLGGLYFTNSIGAALGALISVFVLLPWGGLPVAIATAGVLNLVVAALAACAEPGDTAATSPASATLAGDWVLAEGIDVVDGYPVTLSIDGTTAGGRSASASQVVRSTWPSAASWTGSTGCRRWPMHPPRARHAQR